MDSGAEHKGDRGQKGWNPMKKRSATSCPAAETTCRDEGVVTTQSTSGFCVCLPRPTSAHHELGIAAVLWDVWMADREDDGGEDTQWIIDVCRFDELKLPLMAIISAIDDELSQAGRSLSVLGSAHRRSLAIATTVRACNKGDVPWETRVRRTRIRTGSRKP